MSTPRNYPPAFGSDMAAVLQDEATSKPFAETVTAAAGGRIIQTS